MCDIQTSNDLIPVLKNNIGLRKIVIILYELYTANSVDDVLWISLKFLKLPFMDNEHISGKISVKLHISVQDAVGK